MRTLCDYLYALKVLGKRGERYVLDGDGRLIQTTLRGLFEVTDAYEDVHHHLEGLLRGTLRYGSDVVRKDEEMVRGSGAGGRLLTFPLVTDLIRKKGFARVLDLACGDAAFLIDLCEHNPRVRGYGVDISAEAVAYAQRRVDEAGLSDRVDLFAEDMFEIQRVADRLGPIDAVSSFYGFQELLYQGREVVLRLLDRYRAALPDASFLVCEIPKFSAEELRRRPRGMLEYQLYHALTHQRLATRHEWMDLWRAAGFRKIEEHYLEFARTVIYALAW
jgi:ubiquinone/menaquinone biosynthesis C-methylase UbiE